MHAKITSKTARLARFFTGLILTSVLAACGGAASPGLIKDPSDIKKGRSSIPEGDSGVTFITLPFIAAESGVIKYTTFDISAVARSDYMPVSGEFSAIAGNQYAIQVEVLGDTRIEATEHFGVRLTDASDRLIGELIGEIVNDDFPEFGVSNPVAVERNTGITPLVFTISISEEPVDDFTLQVATRNPEVCKVGYASPREMEACAQDYSPLETTLTFRNGESLSQTVTVQVLADTRIEPDEIVELDVSFNGITKTGVGTIRNDDDMSRVFTSLKMLPARFREDANSTTETICVTFQYALRNAEYYDLHYELVALTEREWDAKSTGIDRADSSDFSLVNTSPESIRFTRSDTESQISLCGIQINDDSVVENDEVFGVRLTNAEGAYFYTGYVFIVDNDVPQFTLSARLGEKVVSTSGEEKTIQVEEPASGINLYTLTFTSDANIARGIQYFWSFPAGEASKDDFDGNLSAGVLSFSLVKESESHADRYEASIELSVKSDDLVEKTEILYLELKDLFGQTLIGPDGRPQKYTIFVNDRNALTLSYNCKVDGTVPTPFYFNEGNTVSCDISWDETIAPNALPITLTHKLLSCNEDEICASDADFDGDFLKGVVIANAQPPVKKANWTFGVLNDELVEAPETANIAVSAKNKDSGRAINIATSDPVSTFKIQDGDTLTLDTSCVKKSDNGVAGADSGLPFTEGDRVECITTTNMVAGNVPDFDLKAELADSCAHGLVCADPHDFKEFPESVIFAKADDVNNGIRTATWTAKIETDNLVELTETARFNLSVKGAVDLSSVTGETIEFTIKDGDELAITFNACPGMPGSTGTVPEFSEGATVTCTAQTNPVADNVPESAITLSVVLDGKCSDNTTGPCADLNDFKQFGKSVTFVMQSENGVDNGIRTASWSAEIEEDNLVELTETARFKLSLVEGAVNLSSDNEETIEFTIKDGDELAITFNACPGMPGSTGTVPEFSEGATVTCTAQTNPVADNVPESAITLSVVLDGKCSDNTTGPCADLNDFKQFGKSVTFVMQSENGVDNGIRTASWSAEIEEDNLVELTETARFKLSLVEGAVNLSSDNEETIEFTIIDGDELAVTFNACPGMQGSTGIVSEFNEGDTVTCTAQTNPVADNVPESAIALSVVLDDECSDNTTDPCADLNDFKQFGKSVTFVMQSENGVDNGIRTASWSAEIEEDNLVELTETARFKLSLVEGAVNLSSDNEETIEFTIIDGDELAVTFNACPGMQGSTGIVSEFNEGDTVTCKIQTNAVAANVPAITLGVELLDCSVEGEEGSSDVVCAESADFGDDAQSGFPASLVLFADTDGVRAETWSSTVRIDNLIEKQETANFVMEVTVPDDVSVDGNSEGKLNFGFNINDGDRLVISYTPDSVDEGRTVTLTASPDIAESVGLITVSLSLAGCANSGEIACADWADFNHILQDNSLEVTFGYGSPTYLLKPEVDQSVEHTETAAFKVSVSKEFSPYFKQSEQSDIQDPVVGISSFAIEDSVSEEIPMTMSGDESFELSGSFSFDIADNDEFKFSMSRAALEGEIYGLTAVGAYQFHKKAVTYGFAFTPAVMVSESDDSCFVGNTDIRCQIEDRNKLLPIDLRNSSESVTLVGSGLEFSIQVELTNSSLLQTLASWFTVAVDGVAVNGVAVNGVAVTGIAPGIYSPVPINQPMLALNAETQSIGVPSVSAESGAIYPAINHIYLNKSGELMVPGEYGGEIYHPDCMIDNLTGLFWKRGSNLCNFKESDPKIDNAQGMPRPTISELLSLYSDPDNPIFGGLTGEIQSSSACPAGTPASVYWFNPDTGAVSCSAPAGPVVVPAETPELFVIPFKEGSLQ